MSLLRIAICQVENRVDIDANRDEALKFLRRVAPSKPDLVLFPECFLTGFSAAVRQSDFSRVQTALFDIRALAEEIGCEVLLPSALKTSQGYLNSGFHLRPGRDPSLFFKESLTESEVQFFTPGKNSARHFSIKGYWLALLICKEASDPAWSLLDPMLPPDAILWPAYWGWDQEVQWDGRLEGLAGEIRANMAEWKSPLIQATFSSNHGSDDRASGPSGRSVAVDSSNELRFSAKAGEPDCFVVELTRDANGSSRISNCYSA